MITSSCQHHVAHIGMILEFPGLLLRLKESCVRKRRIQHSENIPAHQTFRKYTWLFSKNIKSWLNFVMFSWTCWPCSIHEEKLIADYFRLSRPGEAIGNIHFWKSSNSCNTSSTKFKNFDKFKINLRLIQGWAGIPVSREYKPQISLPFPRQF